MFQGSQHQGKKFRKDQIIIYQGPSSQVFVVSTTGLETQVGCLIIGLVADTAKASSATN